MTTLRQHLDHAHQQLAAAGVDSAHADAHTLAAWVLGIPRTHLGFYEHLSAYQAHHYHTLVSQRCQRIPLQYLLGHAWFGPVELHVGPGVFIPRPETEALLEWAYSCPVSSQGLIVDLCTGSGALALALATHYPHAQVIGLDDSPVALQYAKGNCAHTGVQLWQGDVCDEGILSEFSDQVELVVANPPYLLTGERLSTEVSCYEPAHALFGGPDGMQIIIPTLRLAQRLLVSGGWVGLEHDPSCAEAIITFLEDMGCFTQICSRVDWVGRHRFVTACRR